MASMHICVYSIEYKHNTDDIHLCIYVPNTCNM